MKGSSAVSRPTEALSSLAVQRAEEMWRWYKRSKGGPGGPPRGKRGGVVVAGRVRFADAPQACHALGLEPTSIYGSLRRGYVLVRVPICWEDDAKAGELADRLDAGAGKQGSTQ